MIQSLDWYFLGMVAVGAGIVLAAVELFIRLEDRDSAGSAGGAAGGAPASRDPLKQ